MADVIVFGSMLFAAVFALVWLLSAGRTCVAGAAEVPVSGRDAAI